MGACTVVLRGVGDAFHVLGVVDVYVFALDIGEGGAVFVVIVAADGVKATQAFQVDGHVAFGGVGGVENDVSRVVFIFRRAVDVDAFLCAGGEDALAGDAHVCDGAAAGFENEVLALADAGGDACQVTFDLEAHFIGGIEFAALIESAIGREVDGALGGAGFDGAIGIVFGAFGRVAGHVGGDGFHRGDGDFAGRRIVAEIVTLSAGQGDEFSGGEFLHRFFAGKVDGEARGLVTDGAAAFYAGVVLGGHLLPQRIQDHILTGHVGDFLIDRLGVGDAFLDAAGGEGNQKLLDGFRGVHEAIHLFLFGEEGVARKLRIVFREVRVAVEVGVYRGAHGVHVGGNRLGSPAAHAELRQFVIAGLLFLPVRFDGLRVAAQKRLRVVVHFIGAVLHVGLQGLVLAVFPFHQSSEAILLLLDGGVFAFQDGFARPTFQLVCGILVHHVAEIVVAEAAVRVQLHIAFVGDDAVDVHVAALEVAAGAELLVLDVNVIIRPRIEAGVAAGGLAGELDAEGIQPLLVGLVVRAVDGFVGLELHALRLDIIRILISCRALLADAAFRMNGGGAGSLDPAQEHFAARIVFHADGEIAGARVAGELVRIGDEGARISFLVHAHALAGVQGQRAGGNIALAALDNMSCHVRDGRIAKAVIDVPIHADMSLDRCGAVSGLAILVDGNMTAVRLTREGDGDGVRCVERILLHLQVCLLLHQGVVVLLGEAEGPDLAMSVLVEAHHLLVGAGGVGGNMVARVAAGGRDVRAVLPGAGQEGAAIQCFHLALAGVTDLFAVGFHFLLGGVAVIDAPPIELAAVKFVGGGVALGLAGLVVVPQILRRLIADALTCAVGGGVRLPRGLAVRVGFHLLHDGAILPRVGGLPRDLAAAPVQVGDFDHALLAVPGGEASDFQILVGQILDVDGAVAVSGDERRAGLGAALRGIQNGAHDGNMTRAGFGAVQKNAAFGEAVREIFLHVRIGNEISIRIAIAHKDSGIRRRQIVRRFHFMNDAVLLVVEAVVAGNLELHIAHAALDLGIDIQIPRADENVAAGGDARGRRFVIHGAFVSQRRTADVRHRAGLLEIVGLGVVAVLHFHGHGAAQDGAVVFNVPFLTVRLDRAPRVVDVAREVGGGGGVERRAAVVHGVGVGVEVIGHRDGREVLVIAALDGAAEDFRLVLVPALDGLGNLGAFPAKGGVIVVNGAALPGAAGARAPHHRHVADANVVRRLVLDGHGGVPIGVERAAAIHVVPFEVNVPQLGGDVLDDNVVVHVAVGVLMKERVLHVPFGQGLHFLCGGLPLGVRDGDRDRFPVLVYGDDAGVIAVAEAPALLTLLPAICKELIRGGHLALEIVSLLITFDTLPHFFAVSAREVDRGLFALQGSGRRSVRGVGGKAGHGVAIVGRIVGFDFRLVLCLVGLGGAFGDGFVIRHGDAFQGCPFRLEEIEHFGCLVQIGFFILNQRFHLCLDVRKFRHAAGRIGHQDEALSAARRIFEVAQAFLCHLLLQEGELGFVSRLGCRVGAIVFDFLQEAVVLIIEHGVRGLGFAVAVGHVAIAVHLRDPAAFVGGSVPVRLVWLLRVAADGDGLISMNARLHRAIHFHVRRGGLLRLADGRAFTEDVLYGIHPGLGLAVAHGGDVPGLRFESHVPVTCELRAAP